MELVKDYSYNREKYGSILNYDKYSLMINGKRIFIFGGEFHYWRVPDQTRWREILIKYKTGGLNTVRIYFHWGYHSPNEETYDFTGNRDIEYLLTLCEEIGLYVLAAPGPYICAETSAGGFPQWMVCKPEIRIRHYKHTGFLKYDAKFSEYCKQWYSKFIPIMAKHEITTNPKGCVIGLQVENELMRKKIIRMGLDKSIEELSVFAREFGCTTPIFHNDALPDGNWIGGKDPKVASVDLYGFDRYIIWCPAKYYQKKLPEWAPQKFEKAVDKTEKLIRGFGGWAAETPIFVPEIQGGWYLSWGVDHGFDEIYNYYGPDYQKMLIETFIGQGMSMFSMYMYYGATSWGTVNDSDVTNTYDYSACIREFGYMSEKLRKLRLTKLFISSFEEQLLVSDAVEIPDLQISEPNFLARQRKSQKGMNFYFFRNFNRSKKTSFEVTIEEGQKATGTLPYKASFIGIGNYKTLGFHLKISTIPLLLKIPYDDGELWIMQHNDGEMLFEGTNLTTFGNIYATSKGRTTRVKFKGLGSAKLVNEKKQTIYFLAITIEDAETLNADYTNQEWQISWGAYGLVFHNGKLLLEIPQHMPNQVVKYLGSKKPPNFTLVNDEFLRTLKQCTFSANLAIKKEPIPLKAWEKCPIRWDAPELQSAWKKIEFPKERNPLAHGFTNGHITYRCNFTPKSQELSLKLNIRHRATIWINNECVGGHITYSINFIQPGAKNGPDPSFLGVKKYDLSPFIKPNTENTMVILVENLGQNRGPAILNDYRNPRGILSAVFSEKVEPITWEISGIDSRTLPNIFNTAGLLGEQLEFQLGKGAEWIPVDGPLEIKPNDELVWYKTSFEWKKDKTVQFPLRMRLNGKACVHMFVNGMYMGRYWGDYGPQHNYYIMDDLLKEGTNILVLATYTAVESEFKFELLPYFIEPNSGNLDEKGPVFAAKRIEIPL